MKLKIYKMIFNERMKKGEFIFADDIQSRGYMFSMARSGAFCDIDTVTDPSNFSALICFA